jgi:RNase H-fold protein (predicted Holliday junction resolvase)
VSAELKQAHNVLDQIEKIERLLGAYRKAEKVIIGLPLEQQRRLMDFMCDRVELTAAEIGGQIGAVLEGRIAAMKEELHKIEIE